MSDEKHRIDDAKPFGAFEEALLRSAQADAPPLDAHAAWTRFSSTAALVAASTEPTSGVHLLGRAEQSAIEGCAAQPPATQTPAAQTPAAQTPAAQTPAAQTSVALTRGSLVESSAFFGSSTALLGAATPEAVRHAADGSLAERALAEFNARQKVPTASSQWLMWTAVGAMAGSALTATLLSAREHSDASAPVPMLTSRVLYRTWPQVQPSLAAESVLEDERPVAEQTIVERGAKPVPSATTNDPREVRLRNVVGNDQRSNDAPPRVSPPAPSLTSRLAEETARVDAARAAFRSGSHGRAIQLVEAYHLRFPGGVLAPDAEVIAIEALFKSQKVSAAENRAARFLRRYPRDPHAARVQTLSETFALP